MVISQLNQLSCNEFEMHRTENRGRYTHINGLERTEHRNLRLDLNNFVGPGFQNLEVLRLIPRRTFVVIRSPSGC